MNKTFTIESLKFDDSVHRTWNCELVENDGWLYKFVGIFDREIRHPELGVIRRGTISDEYFWTDRWFNIFRFHEPGGALKLFYCNIIKPPVIENQILRYVDLDVDLVVGSDFNVRILDVDEFRENSLKYQYPQTMIEKVDQTVTELQKMVHQKQFPFDFLES